MTECSQEFGVSGIGSAGERQGAFVNRRGDHGVQFALEAVVRSCFDGVGGSLSTSSVNLTDRIRPARACVSEVRQVERKGLGGLRQVDGISIQLEPMGRGACDLGKCFEADLRSNT